MATSIATAWLLCRAFSGIGHFIYDFQTLIAGLVAVAAALYGAAPVYRQLELTRTQSNAVLMSMLQDRFAAVEQAVSAMRKEVLTPLRELNRVYQFDYEVDEVTKISAEAAHHYDQLISGGARWLEDAYRWRDSVATENAKRLLVCELEALTDLLSDAHAPEHTDQVGEDYAMNDEEWAAFVHRAEEAKIAVPEALQNSEKAFRRYEDAQQVELHGLTQKLKAVEGSLLTQN